jgi:hypothetical protein
VEGRGGPRIAFVGGGSYQWGSKIIQDVALNEELRGGTLVLHDINGEALEDMYQWGTRALDVARADLKLEKTQRLEEALRGTGRYGARPGDPRPLRGGVDRWARRPLPRPAELRTWPSAPF